MRRAGIVFLALMLIITASFVWLHGFFLDVADDVTVTTQTLYGDPAAADGVKLLVRNDYNHKLLWETSLVLDSMLEPKTDFTFSNDQIRVYQGPAYEGISFDVIYDVFAFSGNRLTEATAKKYADLIAEFQKAEAAVPQGQSRTVTINLANYLDFYPLQGQVVLPNHTTVFSELEHWSDDSEKIATAINEFFRIPVDGTFLVEYTIDKTNKYASYGASIQRDYFLEASGIATEDACYFTFNTIMSSGVIADTSLIPGGYGIYRLPYDEQGFRFDELKMVYALDPTEAYVGMELSGDGKRIRLHTLQGDDRMMTVIDIATMVQLQKVHLVTYSDEWHHEVTGYDDFLLIEENRDNSDSMDRITVWEELPDGTWAHAFSAEMNMGAFPEKTNLNLFDHYNNAVDYQDGKLVVIKHRMIHLEPYWAKEYCDIYVTVYDATGMRYAGTCQWNLTQVNKLEFYGTKVTPNLEHALEVSW